ncbi:MAG: phosphopentomutase [bacterium]
MSSRPPVRFVVIVLDGVGAGAAPDAAEYGDLGSNTLGNLSRVVGGLRLPNFQSLGLGNLLDIAGVPPSLAPRASFGRMRERSHGKDTTSGHWEMAGCVVDRAFPTYPNGFPREVLEPFEAAIGRGVLANRAASGTAIIEEFGDEHRRTGKPIVYTSADSVFQIAAHEEVIPVKELYAICQTARGILTGPHAVGRVIARPFAGESGAYARTPRRHDFSLPPLSPTICEVLEAAHVPVWGVGKIPDIFAGRGITCSLGGKSNAECLDATLDGLAELERGFLFTNLVETDMLWGHRNDTAGYARALEEIDARVPALIDALGPGDRLVFTADHGCDPTTPSTDHSRELVPLLFIGGAATPRGIEDGSARASTPIGRDLGLRDTFADLAATIADFFAVRNPGPGRSFLDEWK